MKIPKLTTALIVFYALAALPLGAADTTRLDSMPGSKVRIEGTSSLHDWQCEANFIGGFIMAGVNFPTSATADVKPGKVDAKADAWVTARALKSIEKDGKPY